MMKRIVVHTFNGDGPHRGLARMVLVILGLAAMSLMALAQEPPAVTTITEKVVINGQDAAEGMPLLENTVLETPGDEPAIITLADGSTLELGAQSRVVVVKTVATAATTRLMRLKVDQGWVRVKASSAGEETAGLIFDIETPNAVIGAKLAKLNMEVGYDEPAQETVGIAHGVELHAENLLSGEKRDIPRGSTVLLQAENMQVVAGTAQAKSSGKSGSGLLDKLPSNTTLLVVGGLMGASALTAALVNDDEDDVSDADFAGNFERTDPIEGGDVIRSRLAIQEGQGVDLAGFHYVTRSGPNCQYDYTRDLTGTIDEDTSTLTLAPLTYTETCRSGTNSVSLSTETWTCTLRDSSDTLRCVRRDGEKDYQRQ